MADIEMSEASKTPVVAEEVVDPVQKANEASLLTFADLKKNIGLIDKGVDTKEMRFIISVLRQTQSIRKKLNYKVLNQIVNFAFSHQNHATKKNFLLSFLKSDGSSMDIDSTTQAEKETTPSSSSSHLNIEVESYIHLLVLIYLIDQKKYEDATKCSSALMETVQSNTRITLYPLSSKIFFYYSLSYEMTNNLHEVRSTLLSALRTATLRHNDEGQATIINLLLRNYLEYNLFEQADKLLANTQFPESASSNQFARYFYYQGRIRAIQLEYAESFKFLTQAIRKAPQNTAGGFRRTVYKLLSIVQLLMGEIPERNTFSQKQLKIALKPYFHLTEAVRVGDLGSFNQALEQNSDIFKSDQTFTLVQRLRSNVIKAGLKKLNTAYSRISFNDICTKLKFDGTTQDIMFIIAKTIKDGVIDATINYEGGYLQSRENIDAYSTQEPLHAFSNRIDICLKIHNDSLKAMRFHPDLNKAETEKIAEVAKTIKEEMERQAEESSDNEGDSDF
ncbi:26S proteasome regulatory subunit S3 [Dictyostelium discoideum AX4]|uniref:26S proteasome non-ATPase regulatory subunit 3 n=1 Tax=Dictyostelium discoideum TaxID=44689 RepID=PSMD3_DICDI|nr:26S proteasome regulatory subunit S3 [Dictyostelium discoideum AX4]Q1ZXD3.1 RecName: Full=26S proteasome non-ATPase regulatory subunit 3; AltName: Full=26S proteasome regulatory subunit RPN3 [Dictyostelium discoideum]EAS66838.1 26S proteasome regulatory subunit S3 [Dictyostelium discoideum AX4]|eukprot:XP_001134521.1 26S proteasome regulatory subunit S3 [Dictyostelium discoideum AX4]